MTLEQIKVLLTQLNILKPRIIGIEGDHTNLLEIVNEAYLRGLKISIGASVECYTRTFIKKYKRKDSFFEF
jgi:hypothetical protein